MPEKQTLGAVNAHLAERNKDLRETIEALRMEAQARDNLVEALRKANKARDEMSAALIEDLTKEKTINLRWEKFGHDAMMEQAELCRLLVSAGIK